MKINPFRQFNLHLAFLLECFLFIAVGDFGFNLSENIVISILFCAILPLIAINYWGIYQSPNSPRRLQQPHRAIVAILPFGIGAMAFSFTGKSTLALIFITLAFINQVVLFYFDKRKWKGS